MLAVLGAYLPEPRLGHTAADILSFLVEDIRSYIVFRSADTELKDAKGLLSNIPTACHGPNAQANRKEHASPTSCLLAPSRP